MRVPIYMAGRGGIITDIAPQELPPDVFSGGENVYFSNGGIQGLRSDYLIYEFDDQDNPYEGIRAAYITTDKDGRSWLIVFGFVGQTPSIGAKNLSEENSVWNTISVGLNEDLPLNWKMLRWGKWVLFSSSDAPFILTWDFEAAAVSKLTGWPEGYTPRGIQQFRGSLLAWGIKDGSDFNDKSIIWSAPPDIGNLPTDWDFANAESLSGKTELTEGGRIVDIQLVGNQIFIFQEDGIHSMAYIGGTLLFEFNHIMHSFGIRGEHMLANLGKLGVVYIAYSDMYLFNGQVPHSVGRGKIWNELDKALRLIRGQSTAWMEYDGEFDRIWIYPGTGGKIWIYNWREESFGSYDGGLGFDKNSPDEGRFDFVSSGFANILFDDESIAWRDATRDWSQFTETWSFSTIFSLQPTLLGVWDMGRKISLLGRGNEYLQGNLERKNLAVAGQDPTTGQPKMDPGVRKLCTGIQALLKVGSCDFEIEGRNSLADSKPQKSSPQSCVAGDINQKFITNSGQYLDIKIDWPSKGLGPDPDQDRDIPISQAFELTNYYLDIEPVGTQQVI